MKSIPASSSLPFGAIWAINAVYAPSICGKPDAISMRIKRVGTIMPSSKNLERVFLQSIVTA
jgi:hypothetical protein